MFAFSALTWGIISPAYAKEIFYIDSGWPDSVFILFVGCRSPERDGCRSDLIRGSGFTTMMLSSFYFRSNGELVSGDDGHNPYEGLKVQVPGKRHLYD